MWFDANGRKVPDDAVKAWQQDPDRVDRGGSDCHCAAGWEKKMTGAYEEFRWRDDEGEL